MYLTLIFWLLCHIEPGFNDKPGGTLKVLLLT
nr:MAG TPA: hypothetical protein [Caudoviricetes sp.]